MNLKYNYPVIVFVTALSAAVYFSFKHEGPREPIDTVSATPQERQDQITLSAMHSEPVQSSTPSHAAPTPVSATLNATAADLAQLHTLEQVLESKNDNDPRLDRDLRNLSPAAKALIRGRYETTSPEKRNQRGTMIYLVGRELSTTEDVTFLHSVLNEAPCLSLTHCGSEEKGSMTSSDHHHDGTNEITLAYPQLVALKSIENYLARPDAGDLTPQFLAELESQKRSSIRKIALMAEDISQRYHARHH